MLTKFINARVVILILCITILILILFIFGSNAKTKLILQKNMSLATNLEVLNGRILALSQKMEEAVSEIDRQRSKLEETRNKLTQERLKNVQLNEQIEELRARTSSVPQ